MHWGFAEMNNRSAIRGRYAPSPTGATHLGNARTALLGWLSARHQGGAFIWRLEDLDQPRMVEGAAAAALEDLVWLGLDFDEGDHGQGPFPPYAQSQCSPFYEAALEQLAANQHTFPCRLSRRDLASAASAPHRAEIAEPYPSHLRPRELGDNWYQELRSLAAPDAAVRFRVDDEEVFFEDHLQGTVNQNLAREVGDFVLKRRDGLYAYQLAVVVDDLRMGINEVVRGSDLLDSTARQIALIRALGATPPAYVHVPLLLAADGNKLSKRDDAISIASLRMAGLQPQQVVGWLAHSAGLSATLRAQHPRELIADFHWSRVCSNDSTLSGDSGQLCSEIAAVV